MELAEVYRVSYEGPDDILQGIIVCKDEENGYQCLYKDEGLEDEDINITMLKYDTFEGYKHAHDQRYLREDLRSMPPLSVKSLDHIIPNSCIKSSIRAKDGFLMGFYLFGSVYQNVTFEYPYGDPEKFSAPLTEILVAEDGFRYLRVLYAIFNNAVEACVKVILTNCFGPFVLSGVIAARTSAIEYPAYSSLIFHKKHGIKIEVGSEDDIVIPLSRDIVAVPLGHQLILEFSLSAEDNDKMVEHYLVFDAIDDGKSTKSISCTKGELKVEVSWRST